MKKGQIYQGVAGEIRFPNRTVVITEEGEECVVPNALTGQTVEFRVEKARNRRYEGRLLNVLAPSDMEGARDVCPHFGRCGGCLYQSVPYIQQLRLKENQVRHLLDSVETEYKWEGIKASPRQTNYRNKMEYSFGNEELNGPLTVGLHKRGGFYDIIPVQDCRIADSDFRVILMYTQMYFRMRGIPFYHKLKHEGVLRHLLVRKGLRTGEIMVGIVTTSAISAELETYAEGLLELSTSGTIVSVLHMINDGLADVVRADEVRVLSGRDYIFEELLNLRFRITPFSFFQTNTYGAEVLYETVRGYLGTLRDKEVYDLYSGTGTISQVLSPAAKKVIGVEIVEEAVEAARENVLLNHIPNCEFLCGDVLKVIDEIGDRPDVIVLDPPREGIHQKALQKIIAFGVDRIVYISCKPTSLVRDIEVFKASGYRVERACAVDMFAGTQNIEVVAVLSKKPGDMRD
ncbi:MAG: 23S rRNA (uracil(1939)-C(5))-methyltransferase RlmD [Lachnospiraceae bacterium]|nr:23S rRNA (uracil(1939)-C(5))-methyltransferase RlmD [Lachnospiraceae bacterium]MBP5254465.1 23S rRNA (uracil(1939)-C(5))-methyltransferase RlmD [Lachnospiraceae bacterium]